jgi:hypothetical protein
MSEAELSRLLYVAQRRPLAEYGRETIRKPNATKGSRNTWTKAPLTLESIDEAVAHGQGALKENSALIARLERIGWERGLIYKTLVMTGLRQGELASLTINQCHQCHLEEPHAFLRLKAQVCRDIRHGGNRPWPPDRRHARPPPSQSNFARSPT